MYTQNKNKLMTAEQIKTILKWYRVSEGELGTNQEEINLIVDVLLPALPYDEEYDGLRELWSVYLLPDLIKRVNRTDEKGYFAPIEEGQ
jgi:hypothetical protein